MYINGPAAILKITEYGKAWAIKARNPSERKENEVTAKIE
jgi:hypothetical protein